MPLEENIWQNQDILNTIYRLERCIILCSVFDKTQKIWNTINWYWKISWNGANVIKEFS